MYERRLPEPRLTAWWVPDQGPEALPVLAEIRRVLSARYGEAFDSIGYNCYRDGADSVAWHGDRHRETVDDPVVAIVSVGAPRPLRLRAAWRRAGPAVVRPRPRRPVRDGRRLPARLGARRPQGPPRRAAHLDHLPPRRPVLDEDVGGRPVVPGGRGPRRRHVGTLGSMELLVEVAHGADRSTDVVLEVEPGASFGDVADALAFLDGARGGTLTIARTGQTPRRDDRVADVDVRSGDRLTLVDSVNAAFSATPEAFGATLVVTSPVGRRDRAPAALRRQPARARLRQRRRHQGPAGVAAPRPDHRHRRRHDRRPRLEERRRHRWHGDHDADAPAARPDGRDRRPDAVDPRPRARRRGAGVAQPGRVQPPAPRRRGPTAASRSSCRRRPTARAASACR